MENAKTRLGGVIMGRPKGNKTGSVFFNKNKARWVCVYYITDTNLQGIKIGLYIITSNIFYFFIRNIAFFYHLNGFQNS